MSRQTDTWVAAGDSTALLILGEERRKAGAGAVNKLRLSGSRCAQGARTGDSIHVPKSFIRASSLVVVANWAPFSKRPLHNGITPQLKSRAAARPASEKVQSRAACPPLGPQSGREALLLQRSPGRAPDVTPSPVITDTLRRE